MTIWSFKMSEQKRKEITPEGKLCFDRNLYEQEDGKFKAAMVIPVGENLNNVKAMIAEVANARWPGVNLATLNMPIKGPDASKFEKYPYLEGANLIQGSSGFEIPVIDVAGNEVTRENIKGGDTVRFSLSAYAYDFKGKKGIGLNINSVLKVAEGEAFFNKGNAASDFGSVMTQYSQQAVDNFSTQEEENNLSDFNF